MVNHQLLTEEILGQLDERDDSLALIEDQPGWLIEGAIDWCQSNGTVSVKGRDIHAPGGLPLVIPGTLYAITIESLKWQLLQIAVKLIIDVVMSEKMQWGKGAAGAVGATVVLLCSKIEKLESNERSVLRAVGAAKRKFYTGQKNRFPDVSQIVAVVDSAAKSSVEDSLKRLVDKKLIAKEGDGYRVVL